MDQLGSVDHLAVALLFATPRCTWHTLTGRVEALAIEQLQGVQNGSGLFGAVLSRDGAQGILRGLRPVRSGDKYREERVLRGLVLEVGPETDAGDGVHQVAEVDTFVGANARQFADGLAFGPFGQGFDPSLVRDVEGRGHVLLQPLHEVPQEARRLVFVGGFSLTRGSGCEVQRSGIILERGVELHRLCSSGGGRVRRLSSRP